MTVLDRFVSFVGWRGWWRCDERDNHLDAVAGEERNERQERERVGDVSWLAETGTGQWRDQRAGQDDPRHRLRFRDAPIDPQAEERRQHPMQRCPAFSAREEQIRRINQAPVGGCACAERIAIDEREDAVERITNMRRMNRPAAVGLDERVPMQAEPDREWRQHHDEACRRGPQG